MRRRRRCRRCRSRKGSVINISSISAHHPAARQPPYGAIKAAVIHYTTTQAAMYAKDRVRVNCIAPGSIEFPGGVWDRRKNDNPALYNGTLKSIPFGRMGLPGGGRQRGAVPGLAASLLGHRPDDCGRRRAGSLMMAMTPEGLLADQLAPGSTAGLARQRQRGRARARPADRRPAPSPDRPARERALSAARPAGRYRQAATTSWRRSISNGCRCIAPTGRSRCARWARSSSPTASRRWPPAAAMARRASAPASSAMPTSPSARR